MDELDTLHKARHTVLEMLEDRGYTIPEEMAKVPLVEFKKLFANRQCDFTLKEPTTIHVKFLHLHKVRPNNLRDAIQHLRGEPEDDSPEDPHVDPILIVIRNKPNSTLQRIAREYRNVQLFWIQNLLVNITHHRLNPRFDKLSETEIQEVMTQYRLTSKFQIPMILKEDPISRYYAYSTGTVCRITRPSITSGEYISYRCVK